MTAPTRGGADEIREQVIERLASDLVLRKGVHEVADALLSGPLAHLLALRQHVEDVAKELEDHAVRATVEGSLERGEERARWAGKAAAYLTSRDYVHRALDGTP